MRLSSILQCKTFLANALELLASLMQETPATCAALTSRDVTDATVDLITHGGFTVSVLQHVVMQVEDPFSSEELSVMLHTIYVPQTTGTLRTCNTFGGQWLCTQQYKAAVLIPSMLKGMRRCSAGADSSVSACVAAAVRADAFQDTISRPARRQHQGAAFLGGL